MGISGHTKLAAVIGSPVAHSMSPLLLNTAFAAADLDWVYLAFDVPEGEAPAAFDAMRALDIQGYSVTMPHKDAASAGVDELSPAARTLGAVNCIARDGDRLIGHNTDGVGFIGGLVHDTGINVSACRTIVVGAGGAARAVVLALAEAGALDVGVVNRTPERAAVAARLAGDRGRVADAAEIASADVVINATSIGMAGTSFAGELAFDIDTMSTNQVVYDLIYHPMETPIMAAARAKGIEAHNGLSMLVHQAAAAFELWTGVAAPTQAMHDAVSAHLDG